MSTLLIKKKRRKCPVKSGISTELGVDALKTRHAASRSADDAGRGHQESWENKKNTVQNEEERHGGCRAAMRCTDRKEEM